VIEDFPLRTSACVRASRFTGRPAWRPCVFHLRTLAGLHYGYRKLALACRIPCTVTARAALHRTRSSPMRACRSLGEESMTTTKTDAHACPRDQKYACYDVAHRKNRMHACSRVLLLFSVDQACTPQKKEKKKRFD
jgi:hypothetical protein